MASKMRMLLLSMFVAAQFGCSSSMTMHEDYGDAVSRNMLMQTLNVSAPQESHPEVKMDGQKAAHVVDNYRNEGPEVDTSDLTK
jgi:hypothetical protein